MAVIRKPRITKLGRAFNQLWYSSFAGHISAGILVTAGPLLATRLTQDPVLIAGTAALSTLPWLLFGVVIGGLLDRVNRRRALAAATAVELLGSAVVSLALATGQMSIWVLYVVSFVVGTAGVVADTATQSMVPKLLKAEHIESGNARLNMTQTTLQSFVGTPLGSLLYASALWLPFFISSIGYLFAAAFLVFIPKAVAQVWDATSADSNRDASKPRTKFWEDVKFGVVYLYRDKPLLRLVITTAIIGFFFAVSSATAILFMLNVAHVPEAGYGLVLTTQGIASIFGAMHATWWSRKFGRGLVLGWAIIVPTATTIGMAFTTEPVGLVLLMMLNGYAISMWNIHLMSTYHELIPNELFGRIHGTRRTLVWGLMPIGNMVGGWLATYSLQLPLLLGGILGTAVAIQGFGFIRRLATAASVPVAKTPQS